MPTKKNISVESLQRIQRSVEEQFLAKEKLASISNEIRLSLNGSNKERCFCAIQLKRRAEPIIYTAAGDYGKEIPKAWTGISSHYVDPTNDDVRDIQADIIINNNPFVIRIISGWSKSFDRWIFNECEHQSFVRAWFPLVIARANNGKIDDNWHEEISIQNATNAENYKEKASKLRGSSRTISLATPPSFSDGTLTHEIIGTIEIGYYYPNESDGKRISRITQNDALEIYKLIATKSREIYKTLLPSVFDTIAEEAKQSVGAISASLHFFKHNSDATLPHIEYAYKACSGMNCGKLLSNCPIHENGIGQESIREGMPKYRNEEELKTKNPDVLKIGIRSMIATPLLIPKNRTKKSYEGILYLHFDKDIDMMDYIQPIQFFADNAVNAINNAIIHAEQRRNNQILSSLFNIASGMTAGKNNNGRIESIAGIVKNAFSADIVSIYPTNPDNETLHHPPTVVGKTYSTHPTSSISTQKYIAAEQMLHYPDEFHSCKNIEDDIVFSCELDADPCFLKSERIVSAAGSKLNINGKTIGILIILFRREKEFDREEQDLLKTLTSSIAIAILDKFISDANFAELTTLKIPTYPRIGRIGQELLLESSEFRSYFKNKRSQMHTLSIDIRKSTTLMECADTPDAYASFIHELEQSMRDIIKENWGVIDKFTGDGLIAYFPKFYSGPYAGIHAIKSAALCRDVFIDVYDKHRHGFKDIVADTGLGIGIDYGEVLFQEQESEVFAVGMPIVKACRLSAAPAGCIYVNNKAYMDIDNTDMKDFCQFHITDIDIKHQGPIRVYKATDINIKLDIPTHELDFANGVAGDST